MTLQIILMIAGFTLFMVCLIWLNIIAEGSTGKIFIFIHPRQILLALKKRAKARKVLIIGITGLVLIIIGLVPVFAQMNNDESQVKQIVLDLARAASSDDVNQAFQYFSSESTEETVNDFITNYGNKLKNIGKISTSDFSISFSQEVTAELSGYLINNNGTALPFGVSMVKENGIWKIMGINIY
jgi:hypothetical protein